MIRALLVGAGLILSVLGGGMAQAQAPAAVDSGRPGADADAVERRLVFLLERFEQLERELRQMRGELERTGHELEGVKNRQRELYLDLDRRLRDLELGATTRAPAANPAPAAPAGGEAAPPAATPPYGGSSGGAGAAPPAEAPAMPTAAERQAYDDGFSLLKQGRYDRAIEAFAQFLAEYPNSSYADNAQYWSGEANYVSRNYDAAAKGFQQVIEQYAGSSKVPDAMLKLGFTHYELKDWQRARELLERVVREYPDSTAASLAKTRLQRMRSEGH